MPALPVELGRESCGDFDIASRKEWLVTNGLGGYAMGTVAGCLTRRYHGLLVAALQPPLGRTLLVTKFDETAHYAGQAVELFNNRWADGRAHPDGWRFIERFRLDGLAPVWTFALGDALLEKKIWMRPGANTTCIRYSLVRGQQAVRLSVKALVNYRDHHGQTKAGTVDLAVAQSGRGLRVSAAGRESFRLLADRGKATAGMEWYRGYALSVEQYRGFDGLDDHLMAGTFEAALEPGESVTFTCTAEALTAEDADAWAEQRAHETGLLDLAPDLPTALVLAADQFVVRRPTPRDPDGRTVIAGYPWFSDWGRDTMISLPGLTLATGRPAIARSLLLTFAQYVDRGMIPNRFPDEGQQPEYNTVDATLWYFEALRAYHAATGDDSLLRELYPSLQDIVAQHRGGTRYQIRVDPADGLLFAGEPGVQLTWMDAKAGDWVVTPRIGKPVEINALWHNALRIMAAIARRLARPEAEYLALADRARASFARYWHAAAGHCFDVIDGPAGDDLSLRPNQLLAVSLPHSPLAPPQQKAVVDVCALHLLTSHGLRSLAPSDPAYVGRYGGDLVARDGAYHQGTVWSWLIGPFVSAHLRVYRNAAAARSFLDPLLAHLADHGLGSISEIFDGDPPHTPRGCIAQAWGVAEVLRTWREIQLFEAAAMGEAA